MVNAAAVSLLIRSNQGRGLSFGSSSEELKKATKDRYLPVSGQRQYSLLTEYLDGDCKLSAGGVSNQSGWWGKLTVNTNDFSKYKEYAEKQVNMITPPSFMEKVMHLRQIVESTKVGRVVKTSTLGMSALATGMVSLAARAYGRATGMGIEKFDEQVKNASKKESFAKRFEEVKKYIDFKNDIKKLNKLTKASDQLNADRQVQSDNSYSTVKNIMVSPDGVLYMNLLCDYLQDGRLDKISVKGDTLSSWHNGRHDSLENAGAEITRIENNGLKVLEMVAPATLKEKLLFNADEWIMERKEEKSVNSKFTKVADFVIKKAVSNYIKKSEQKDVNFKGRESFYKRLASLKGRGHVNEDLDKLSLLKKKMNQGR